MEGQTQRQLKSSFVRPYTIPGGPVEAASNENEDVNGTVKPSVPTSYAETLLFHKSFYFQQRRGTLDLRGISRVDVEKIIREVDIDTLQGYLENITFSDVTGEDLALYSDETFVRLFQITQLTLEYLLNVQDTLASNLDSLAQKYSRKKRELERLKGGIGEKDDEIKKLKREMRRRAKTISAYEAMLRQAPPPPDPEKEQPGSKKKVVATDEGEIDAEDEIHVYIIRYFVGVCLDLAVPAGTTVLELKAKISKLTGSSMPITEQSISLKGLQLKDGDRLMDAKVRDESVLVLMDGEKPRAEVQAPPAQPQIIMQAPPAQTGVNMDAEITKLKLTFSEAAAASQAELSAAAKMLEEEVKKGKEREERMKEEMERRVKLVEETIRHEVKQEVMLREKSAAVGPAAPAAPGVAGGVGGVAQATIKVSGAGELESDDEEEEVLTRTEIAMRMRESEERAGRMEKEFLELRKSTEGLMGEKKKKDEEMEKMREELERVREELEDEREKEKEIEEEVEREKSRVKELEEREEERRVKEEEEEERKAAAAAKLKKSEGEPMESTEGSKEEAGSLASSWTMSYDGKSIELEVGENSDIESVRKSLAEKMQASAEQVVFLGDGKGEVGEEGQTVIQDFDTLRGSYESGTLKIGVKKDASSSEITFASVAMKMKGVDEAIKKFSDKVMKESERREKEEKEEKERREREEMKARVEKSLTSKLVTSDVVAEWDRGHVKQWVFNLTKDAEVADKFETRGVTGKMLLDDEWVKNKLWNQIGGGGIEGGVKRRIEGYVRAMKVKGKGEDDVEEEIKKERVKAELEEKLRKEKEQESESEEDEEEEDEEDEEEDKDGKKKKEAEEKAKKLGKGGCCSQS